ncbi:MAG TPA: glycosyltransferase family A protein [Rhizomicrobium sp.]|jgi:hypothetical protein|nr:glycosyltransferase family A protein [Rhizomicrobium sp.]
MPTQSGTGEDGIAATGGRIATLARLPGLGAWTAWRWQRAGRHAEALALLDRAGIARLRLRSLFALDLHRPFLDVLGTAEPRGWQIAARGLARLAVGELDLACGDLAEASSGAPRFGLWLRAASALAQIDKEQAKRLLEPKRHAAPAALLLSHLAERAGDAGRAAHYSPRLNGRRAAETDLLAANIALLGGDAGGAKAAAGRAFARYGLSPADAPCAETGGPLVSIVVAAYNAQSSIETSVASLARQSWRQVEIVVVDDASSDATAERVAAMAETDARIRVLRQQSNEGAYVARNAGVAAARGAFVAFHDADDIAHPARIARQIAPLLHDETLAFTTARWARRTDGGAFRSRQIAPLIRQHVGSFLVRRDALGKAGPFDPVRFGADGEMLLRLQVAAGPRGYRALDQLLTIGGWDARSAVHDDKTGYGERGFSLARLEYRETATWRLIRRLQGR